MTGARDWLTTEAFDQEWQDWPNSNRNHQDLRFGQYLCNKYYGVPDSVFDIESRFVVSYMIENMLHHTQR